jgi:hypothetical protein
LQERSPSTRPPPIRVTRATHERTRSCEHAEGLAGECRRRRSNWRHSTTREKKQRRKRSLEREEIAEPCAIDAIFSFLFLHGGKECAEKSISIIRMNVAFPGAAFVASTTRRDVNACVTVRTFFRMSCFVADRRRGRGSSHAGEVRQCLSSIM